MLFTWIIVLALEFSLALIYFTISEPVHIALYHFMAAGAPAWFIDLLSLCFNLGFVVLGAGLIIYAILRAVRVEHDTYH